MYVNPSDNEDEPDRRSAPPDQSLPESFSPAQLLGRANGFLYATDFATQRLTYLSQGIEEVLGYRSETWQRAGTSSLTEHVHPDDLNSWLELRKSIRKELRTAPAARRTALRFAYSLRYLAADGRTVHLAFHRSFLSVDASGRPLRDVVVVTDITPFRPRPTTTLHISESHGTQRSASRTIAFPRQGAVHFSERELEVLRLVAEGHSSADIADKLFITYNTVSTHRKNMMKKAGVKRAVGLVSFARKHGLLD